MNPIDLQLENTKFLIRLTRNALAALRLDPGDRKLKECAKAMVARLVVERRAIEAFMKENS